MKLILVGPSPPPIGGVATHIQRLLPFLDKDHIDYVVFNHGTDVGKKIKANYKSPFWYLRFLFTTENNIIVHFHQTLWGFEYLYWFLFSIFNTNKIIITLHNNNITQEGKQWQIARLLLKKTKCLNLLVVSDKVHSYLLNLGINNTYLPAYVPPQIISSKKILPKSKMYFVFAVFKATEENLIDIYGFDFVMELLKKVKDKYNLLMLVGDKKQSNIIYLNDIIKKYNNEEYVTILYNKNLVDYLPNVNILVRPNRKDGYGISLQEALDYNVIPIASDVCNRPKGTILYKNNSFEDFYEKFVYVDSLDNQKKNKILSRKEDLTYHLKLLELYKKYLNGDK